MPTLRTISLVLVGGTLLASLGSCSEETMGPRKDQGASTDTKPDGKLVPIGDCATPGKPCKLPNPCAINPICGQDYRCRATKLLNCDDKLSCTVDTCTAQGTCRNVPRAGTCVLPVPVTAKPDAGTPDAGAADASVKEGGAGDAKAGDAKMSDANAADAGVYDASVYDGSAGDGGVKTTELKCFKQGQRHPKQPCMVCDPGIAGPDAGWGDVGVSDMGTYYPDLSGPYGDPFAWTAVTGGTCNDGNACTESDTCVSGVCKGNDYSGMCKSPVVCQEVPCDGKGGCLPAKLKSGYCLIMGDCYKDQTPNPDGTCTMCDVKTAQTSWTPIKNACTIGGLCYKAGDKDPTGCFVCDPKTSTSSWTKVSGLCSIGGKCYTKGTLNSGKCAECDPSASTTSWTVKGNACLISDICRKPGDKDTSGCGQCDPTKDKYKWSAVSNTCLISGICYSNGALDVTKCKVCDPSKNSTGWSTRSGVCDVEGSCYSNGDKHPGGCAECDTSVSLTSWTVKGNFCYVDKGCRKPGDKDPSGCRECTPATSKYAWTPSSGRCYIGSTCYRSGDKDSTTCGSCVPATSQTSWTVTGNVCLINGTCYQPGALSSNKCGKCDPSSSKSSWSAISGKCLIHGACYADGATHSSGCLKCDYSTSSTLWSATGSSKLSTYTFESGKTTGWTISAKVGTVGWQVSNNRKATGSYSLYFGDAQNKTYGYGNSRVNGTAVTPQFTVAAGKKAGLTFDLWMDVEAAQGFDYLRIYVTGETKVLWEKNVTETVKMKSWQPVSVDLSAHAGKTISVTFEFDTKDGTGNTGEGVYIDDLFVYHDC